MHDQLLDFLRGKGFELPGAVLINGSICRFDRKGSSNAWFTGKILPSGLAVARFGDWKTGETYDWTSKDLAALPPGELQAFKDELAAQEKAEQAERAAIHEQVAVASLEWVQASGIDRGSSPYFVRKMCGDALFGCFLDIDSEKARQHGIQTMVPARDVHGKLWGLQRIGADGFKSFKEGMKIRGCFHVIKKAQQELTHASRVILCEGVSTGASLAIATGEIILCAFNAGNLVHVAGALKAAWPGLMVFVAGDDDRWTTKGTESTPWNPGREYARAAAKVSKTPLFFPIFSSLKNKPTDFNDLHVREGIGNVHTQWVSFLAKGIEHAGSGDHGEYGSSNEPNAPSAAVHGAIPPKVTKNAKGEVKFKPPSHQEIAETLLKQYGVNLIKQDRDLFFYTGKHWRNLSQGDHDTIRQQLQKLAGGSLTAPGVSSCYALFMQACASVPEGVNLFAPPHWAANFKNGTLFVTRDQARGYGLEFKPHRREDWVTNVLPYDYVKDSQEKNLEFDAMLERVFEGDPDKREKIKALAQMFGACLLPAFPHLFMLHGKPKTGKSTVIMLATRLAHPENCCSVDPTEFEGFNMESMPGKLVNFDTDIETNKPLIDKQIKKIIDRLPFRIRRKGIKDILAPIPSTHIFGGNGIPKTLDGASKAHDRRWTFLEFLKVVENDALDYVDFVFNAGPGGILNFALAGLRDLLDAKGKFVQPASGQTKMEEWQRKSDIVGTFLHELKQGRVLSDKNSVVSLDPEGQIPRKALGEIFESWRSETFGVSPRINKIAFFDRMRELGFVEKRVKGYDYWSGISSVQHDGGTH